MSRTATKRGTAVKKKVAKKKAAPKKKVDPTLLLERMIKKSGYSILRGLGDSYADYNVEDKNENYITSVTFNIKQLEYCCGVKEIGDFYIDEDDKSIEDLTKAEKTVLEMVIALAFTDAAKRDLVRSLADNPVKRYRPIIFCSNGQDGCQLFESAAKKYLRSIYKLVCTSKNPGSGSIIKTYISQL